MSWVLLSIFSAFLLGFYDLAKKHSVKDNAVAPVLFFSVLTAALIWAPFVIWSYISPETFPSDRFYVETTSALQHAQLFVKSALVGTSWIFGYFAIKHLPLSIAGPIRATSPLWTILLAVIVFGERPAFWQWTGIVIVFLAFYAFSFVGKLEGIRFHRDKWVGFVVISTLLGSCSALYDKYLLQSANISPATVQAWFSIYLVAVMLPFYLLWKRAAWPRGTFVWRWSIPLIGILLLLADFLYFTAVAQEGALISVISPIRRGAVIITFLGGMYLYQEKNFRPKAVCVLVILLGIALIQLSTQ